MNDLSDARASVRRHARALEQPIRHLLDFFFFNDTATTEIYTFPYTTLFRSRRSAAAGGWPAARRGCRCRRGPPGRDRDRKSTRLNSSHVAISYAVFCLKK